MCPETNRELGGQPWNNNSKYRQIQNNFFLSQISNFFLHFEVFIYRCVGNWNYLRKIRITQMKYKWDIRLQT